MHDTAESTYAGINLAEARQLVNLMSNAVSELEERSESEKDTLSEESQQRKASRPLLVLASAASQLGACVRPPNIAVAEIGMGVSACISNGPSLQPAITFMGTFELMYVL